MKTKKLLLGLLSTVFAVSLSFGFASCRVQNDDTQNEKSTNQSDSITQELLFQKIPGEKAYQVAGIGNTTDVNIVIPSTYKNLPVKGIAKSAFANYDKQFNITLSNNITFIGEQAFKGCSKLAMIEFSSNLISIGDEAFYNCSKLVEIILPNKTESIGKSVFYSCKNLEIVTIPDNITSIGDSSFYNCSSLTSVTIPNSVTSIGDSSFYNCSSLTSVTIPNSVTSIGNSTFYDCSSLTSVTIPNSVTSIGASSFYNCSSLTSITIPDSVTSIGNSTFYDCDSLTEITLPFLGASKTATGYQAVFGYIFGYTKTSSSSATNGATYQYCEASDTSYWSDKYYHYYIPASLKNVTITGGKIGENAFYNCSGLTNISIPNSITTIGEKAFCNCSSLSSIVIGNKVNSIGIEAFNECSSLTSVYYKGTSTDRLNISIDSNNQALTNATWFYYKATEPNLNANGTAYNGNYWRYVDGVATPWVYGKEN